MKNKKNKNSSQLHTPVLINEAIDALGVCAGKWYVDATIGMGGHTEAILKKGGYVLGFDQDEVSLELVREKYASYIEGKKLELFHSNFRNIEEELGSRRVAGVLFDFGISTYQIEHRSVGISFLRDEPLDMRLSGAYMTSAADIINTSSEDDLAHLFAKYGEERSAALIAKEIVTKRKIEKIEQTSQLAQLVTAVYESRGIYERIHPATRVFQALRIAVNDELESIKEGLKSAYDVLEKEGKIVAISFHSLEDRIVKQVFQQLSRRSGEIVTKHPIVATEVEIAENSKSRSAKMRVFRKK